MSPDLLVEFWLRVVLKPHHSLSSLFLKLKDDINFELGMVYQNACRVCNAVHAGEAGRSVRERKRLNVDAFETFNSKNQPGISQHLMDILRS